MFEKFDNRRHFRLKEFVDINWKVGHQAEEGEGTILNISSSGALLQTDKVFTPSDNCVMSIAAPYGESLPFSPKKAKVMWFRRVHTPQERYQCGVQFLETGGYDKDFQQWLEERVTKLSEAANANILNNYIV